MKRLLRRQRDFGTMLKMFRSSFASPSKGGPRGYTRGTWASSPTMEKGRQLFGQRSRKEDSEGHVQTD